MSRPDSNQLGENSSTFHPPQPNQAFMIASALESGNMVVPLDFILADRSPDDQLACPSLSFHLIHSHTGKRVVFDLGLPRDFTRYPPVVQGIVTMLGEGESAVGRKGCFVRVERTAEESLRRGGVRPEEVDFVVLSHLHFDHTGDHRSFTKATFVVGGGSKSLLETGYPKDPTSQFSSECLPLERTRFLDDAEFTTSIGPFPRALDFFGDGSMYIVDMPGHLPGSINLLARTSPSSSSSPSSWLLLLGDTAHHIHLLIGHAQIAHTIDPSGVVRCAHVDKEAAKRSIERVRKVMEMGIQGGRVRMLMAHDVKWCEENVGREGGGFLPGVIPPMGE